MAFNRDRNSRPGGGFRSKPPFGSRPKFNDRGPSRGPVEMHKAICDNCGKECEVPFRPTSGKPIFCSNCFKNKRGTSDSKRSTNFEDRPMFNATCADCGDKCKVPFRPSGDKPVFCSNCFGDKKNVGGSAEGRDKFEELNAKLDSILKLLSPVTATEEAVIKKVEKPVKVEKKKTKVKETISVKEE